MTEPWKFRSGTLDQAIFNGVVVLNEYRLPDSFTANDIVIDIGSHIGAFAEAVVSRGCRKVCCIEPDRGNCEIAAAHLRPYIENGWVDLVRGAAWRSDRNTDELYFDGYQAFPESFPELAGIMNTGSGSVMWGGGEPVAKLPFDDIVDRVTDHGKNRVRLLKLDCEGAEWPILLTSRKLDLINAICGEFHELGGQFLEISDNRAAKEPVFSPGDSGKLTIDDLVAFLKDAGFTVTYRRHRRPNGTFEGLGLFFATRARIRPGSAGTPEAGWNVARQEGGIPAGRPRPRVKLIAIGFNTHGTGLTRVMHSIMRRLADRHEIHYLGIGYAGETIRDRGLTIYPTNPKGGDVFAAFQAKQLIEEIDPEVVFILHDIWLFNHYLRIFEPYRDRVKLVCYIPLDGNIANEGDAAALERAHRVVVYTEFARKEFEDAFARLREKLGGAEFPAVDVVPHGVDRDRFHPFAQLLQTSFASVGRIEPKRKLFPDLQDPENSFVVLNASRPDKRKRVDLTLEGFARFAAGKPANVRLCLHHAIMGEPEQEQIGSLIERLQLNDRVYLNPLGGRVVDDRELNLLYNACDVGITTSMGEGWGLVSFEHGSTGAAQIVPDHSACAEIWRGRAEMIEPARRYIPEFSVLEMGEVSPEGVVRALNNLYQDPQRRQHLAQAAFEAAREPQYSWDAIANRFDDLFVELAG